MQAFQAATTADAAELAEVDALIAEAATATGRLCHRLLDLLQREPRERAIRGEKVELHA